MTFLSTGTQVVCVVLMTLSLVSVGFADQAQNQNNLTAKNPTLAAGSAPPVTPGIAQTQVTAGAQAQAQAQAAQAQAAQTQAAAKAKAKHCKKHHKHHHHTQPAQ